MQKRNLKKSVFPAAVSHRTLPCFHSATGGPCFAIALSPPRSLASAKRGRAGESSSCGKHSAFCILHSTFSSAFSLIELIVVMMVIGILATTVIIKFTGVNSENNRVAANELRSHLTYIRNMAMNYERGVRVRFFVVSNSYDVYVAVTNWTGAYLPAKDPVTQKDWIVDLNSKFSGVTLSAVNINGGNTLYFSETNGMPFDAGLAPLTQNGVITFKDSTIRVRVIPITGYADLIEKEAVVEPIELEPLP